MAQRLIDAARFERRLMFTVDRDEICDDCLRNFLNEMAKEPTIDPVKHEPCYFCERYNFANARVEVNKYGAYISLAGGSTQFPRNEQFNFCPVCGRKL